MAPTTTYKTLIERVLEETGLGFVLGTVTGVATGWSGATSYTSGPFTAQRLTRGSAILATAGTAINENSYIDTYTPSTGAGTVEPDFSTTWTDAVIAYFGNGIDHMDRVKEAINRATQQRGAQWQKVVLTYVPDGEFLGTAASFWTGTNTTLLYVDLAKPEVGARVLQGTSSSSSANIQSNSIPTRPGEQWMFNTAIRVTTGTTVSIQPYDVTNSAVITASYETGTGSNTGREFVTQKGTFTVPATCTSIAFRLATTFSGTVSQMLPLFAAPVSAASFPFTNRVEYENIGDFYYVTNGTGVAGPDESSYSDQILNSGREVSIDGAGDHLVASFNFTPGQPVYYDELVYGSALSALTDTTTMDAEYILKWAKYELYKYLYDREPEKWKLKAFEAKRAADRFDQERVPMKVLHGRRNGG